MCMCPCVRARICMRNVCGIVPLSVLASAYYRWCHQAQGYALDVVTSLGKLRCPKAEACQTRTVAEASPQPISLREGVGSRMLVGCSVRGVPILHCVRLRCARLVSTGNYCGRWDMTPLLPVSHP